ncbi:MAG: hypothetical protein GX660_05980 [Clostridiaceae bacterium]|nr:hypothetical protein [Clostridiaceae bacterium]
MDREEYELICKRTWFSLLVDGSLKLFENYEVLKKYLKALEDEDFYIYHLDCNQWLNTDAFEKDYMIKISGGDLEKFSTDISRSIPDKEGTVLVLENFDNFLTKYFDQSVKTLNLINCLSWQYLLFGKKLIVFIKCINDNGYYKKLCNLKKTPFKNPFGGIGMRHIDSE